MNRILVAIMLMLAACTALATQPAIGQFPPAALGKDRVGNAVNLEDHRGKVVIVTFWASWCGPCRKELTVLGHFQKAVGRDALEVIAVNYKESRRDFLDIIRRNRDIDLTWVYDAKGASIEAYGVTSIPRMFILDHDGRVVHAHRGYDETLLPTIVEEILALLPEEVKRRPPRET